MDKTKAGTVASIFEMNPIGWYDADSYNSFTNSWHSKIDNSQLITQNLRKFDQPFPFIMGGTNSTISNIPWSGINKDYTFIHLARYNGDTRGRIWTGTTGNWLSGFWNNSVSFFHEGWIGQYINVLEEGRNWLLTVDMNNFARINKGKWEGNGPSYSPESIGVNIIGPYSIEKSDFAIAEFIIFDRHLTKDEYIIIENYLTDKYKFNI